MPNKLVLVTTTHDIHRITLNEVECVFSHECPSLSQLVGEAIPSTVVTAAAAATATATPTEPIKYPNKVRQVLLSTREKTELTVTLPESYCQAASDPSCSLVLKIEYSLSDPTSAVNFLCSAKKEYFQVFAAGAGRLWIPCFEEVALPWDLEYHVSLEGVSSSSLIANNLMVASSGALCQQFLSPDGKFKTFKFELDIPTHPSAISFAAGLFDSVKIPAAPFAMALCPLGMGSKLHLAMEFFSRAFGFVNWYLSCVFPYPSYYVVFLKDAVAMEEMVSGANVSIYSSLALFDSTIIDQNLVTRRLLCRGLAAQYFGVRLWPSEASSRWATTGICGYLAQLTLRVFHGHNDYRYGIKRDMAAVMDVDAGHGPLTEAPELFANPADETWFRRKAYLALCILENRLEKGVLQKILSHVWSEFIAGKLPLTGLSTSYFLKACKKVSGKDIKSFAEQWIFSAGSPVFSCSFSFNRKRSIIEVTLKQSTPGNPQKKVSGSLLIRVHEIDGVFDHHVHIDDFSHHFELPVHAKAKKIKKKKKTPADAASTVNETAKDHVVKEEGEEDAFVSPLSWIRLDPEIEWISHPELHQPEFMLIEQLQNDRDVIAQQEAIASLRRDPTDAVVEALEKVLNDPKCFYRIRIEAAEALAGCVPNPDTHIGGLKLISFYNKGFALQSSETLVVPVPRPNNFEALQSYFIQKALPGAMSLVRTKNATLMELVGQVLLNMMRFNDNSSNAYSDNYHVAGTIKALSMHLQARKELGLPVERLGREFVKELDRYAIVEKIQPYYHNTVMVAILEAINDMRRIEVPISQAIVKIDRLLGEGNFIRVRLAALHLLLSTETTLSSSLIEALKSLLGSRRPGIRQETLRHLLGISPRSMACRSGFEAMGESLWSILQTYSGDLPLALQHLFFASRVIEAAPADAPVTAPRLSIKVPLPTASQEASEEEQLPQQPAGIGEEEPDWFLEVAGGHGVRARPSAITNASVPKLRLAVTPVDPSVPLLGRLLQIHQAIWNNYDSFPFRFPVDPSVGGYYEVIRNPMDLGAIRDHLNSSSIKSVAEYCDALRLMFDNCFFFNQPESQIYEQAKRLRSFAFKELKNHFPDLAKDIKGILMTKEPVLVEQKPTIVSTRVEPSARPPKIPKVAAVPSKAASPELSETERMSLVLSKIRDHPYAFWFVEPVDPVALNIPTYLEVIKEPMDLSTLESRIGSINVREFVRLVDLIFTNATTFNPATTAVHQNAIQMRREAQRLVKRYFPDVKTASPASDRERARAVSKAKIGALKLKLNLGSSQVPSVARNGGSWREKAQRVLEQVCGHEYAGPFLEPVDPVALGIPTYPKIIKKPMDLSTIRKKLTEGRYVKPTEMNADVKLMFSNCYRFNGKTAPISEAAKVLESYYDSLYPPLNVQSEE